MPFIGEMRGAAPSKLRPENAVGSKAIWSLIMPYRLPWEGARTTLAIFGYFVRPTIDGGQNRLLVHDLTVNRLLPPIEIVESRLST